MNPKHTTLAMLAAAAVGLGACGGSADTVTSVQEQTEQISKDAATIREDAAEVTRDAKAGKDTTAAQQELRDRADEVVDETRGVADDVLEDAKGRVQDDASRKAIEGAQEQIQPVP